MGPDVVVAVPGWATCWPPMTRTHGMPSWSRSRRAPIPGWSLPGCRTAGLDVWWAHDGDGGEDSLLVGRLMARLGAEADQHTASSDEALDAARRAVRGRWAAASLDAAATLHLRASLD